MNKYEEDNFLSFCEANNEFFLLFVSKGKVILCFIEENELVELKENEDSFSLHV